MVAVDGQKAFPQGTGLPQGVQQRAVAGADNHLALLIQQADQALLQLLHLRYGLKQGLGVDHQADGSVFRPASAP